MACNLQNEYRASFFFKKKNRRHEPDYGVTFYRFRWPTNTKICTHFLRNFVFSRVYVSFAFYFYFFFVLLKRARMNARECVWNLVSFFKNRANEMETYRGQFLRLLIEITDLKFLLLLAMESHREFLLCVCLCINFFWEGFGICCLAFSFVYSHRFIGVRTWLDYHFSGITIGRYFGILLWNGFENEKEKEFHSIRNWQ